MRVSALFDKNTKNTGMSLLVCVTASIENCHKFNDKSFVTSPEI